MEFNYSNNNTNKNCINCMNVFVVVFTKKKVVYSGIQCDDGEAAYELAKKLGGQVRLWEMYGLNHLSELDKGTREEIKSFIRGLSNN